MICRGACLRHALCFLCISCTKWDTLCIRQPRPYGADRAPRIQDNPLSPDPAIASGDKAFVLVARALALLMTPALAFFYGGLVRGKNALNAMMKIMSSFLPLRVDDRAEGVGLDLSAHGEEAYAQGEGAVLASPGNSGDPKPVAAPVPSFSGGPR